MQFVKENDLSNQEKTNEPVDNRPLYHRLKEVKDKKQEEFDESRKFKNQFRGIDDGESEFLSMVDKVKEEQEFKRKQEEKDLIKESLEANLIAAPSTSLILEKPQKLASVGKVANKQASLIARSIRKRARQSDEEFKEKASESTENCSSEEVPKKLLHVVGVLPGLCAYNEETSDDSDSDSSKSDSLEILPFLKHIERRNDQHE